MFGAKFEEFFRSVQIEVVMLIYRTAWVMHDVEVNYGVYLLAAKNIFETPAPNICALEFNIFWKVFHPTTVDTNDVCRSVQTPSEGESETAADTGDDDALSTFLAARPFQKKYPVRSDSPRSIKRSIAFVTTVTFSRIALSSSSGCPSK